MITIFNSHTIRRAILSFLFFPLSLQAQEKTLEQKKSPYYIDINKAQYQPSVFEVQPEALGLRYDDKFGKSQELPLTIYNWKKEAVAKISLTKTFGLNYFNVKLADLYNRWEVGKIYICELKDEANKNYKISIKIIPPPDKVDPKISIFVNPVSLECNNPLGKHVVEFYGQIDGGKAPYAVDWFILNSLRTDFLYQPTSEEIKRPGKSSVVIVDKEPDYYVLLKVKDACGSIQQKMVHLVCDPGKKKINSLFVEPLSLPSATKTKIQ